MRNGICPKCRSAEVYRGFATEGEGLTAGSYCLAIEIMSGIPSNGHSRPERTRLTLWVDTYICRTCGYVETHVSNTEDLDNLPQADGWEKVHPHPPP